MLKNQKEQLSCLQKHIGVLKMRTRLHLAFFGVSCCLMALLIVLSSGYIQAEASVPNLPPMSLTVIGLNGTTIVLNSTDIASLPSTTGEGGFRPSVVDNYTGVPVTTLCNLVGGIDNDSIVKITGSDNYSQTFTYDQAVNGNITAYDPVSGNITQPKEPLTLIIAYYKDDANLTTTGPLSVAIVGPEGLGTVGKIWVYYVAEIQVLNASAVPEFQPFSLTIFILTVASAGIIFSKKRSRNLVT